MTLQSNLILKDKKLFIEAKKPFFILESSAILATSQKVPIEPKKTGSQKRRNGAGKAPRLKQLADLDDDRTLKYENEYMVRHVYQFFQSFTGSPFDIFLDWFDHDPSLEHRAK